VLQMAVRNSTIFMMVVLGYSFSFHFYYVDDERTSFIDERGLTGSGKKTLARGNRVICRVTNLMNENDAHVKNMV
jgi:hypothetical protein